MTKRLIIGLLATLPALFILAACENAYSYSKQLEAEEKLIDAWIERNGITLIDQFPEDSLFQENEMYHYPDGIYFQLLEKGEGEPMEEGDVIVLRYMSSTLDENPVTEDYWTTADRPYPNEVVYGSSTNSCTGWDKAFELMKRSGARARIIVPSKLGFNDAVVTPYLYEMKIKVLPK